MSFLKSSNVVNGRRDFELLDVAFRIMPKARYSGDHCEAVRLGRGQYGLIVVDSSHTGRTAQLQARAICDAMIARVSNEWDPKLAMQDIAQRHVDRDERFATVLYVKLDLNHNKGKMFSYRAGHDLPIHISSKTHKSRRLKRQKISPLPIGVSDISTEKRLDDGQLNRTRAYEPKTGVVKQGDFVALFTDGITESRDSGGEELGRKGLEHILLRVISSRRFSEPERIVEAVFERLGEYHAHDDATLLVARYK